jgi:hypothetical protein
MRFNISVSFVFMILFFCICSFNTDKENIKVIKINNTLAINRINEIVSIDLTQLQNMTNTPEDVIVKDNKGNLLVTQIVDNNLDGMPDELLFQVSVTAKSQVEYTLFFDKGTVNKKPVSQHTTFARFVPERTDDYTWENDVVAFRTYGPVAQRLAEEGKEGGTLSSGIDLWLKKVKYSIINDWYAKNLTNPGYYHIDRGEGYDPYHVGKSRGTGGTGIWHEDSLLVSKNFIKHKLISSGPLRAIFELEYASWSKFGVKETKRVSLDLGSNFTKFENTIFSEIDIPNYTIGITLHDEKGDVKLNTQKGIFRHWEPISDSFVGEGIILAPSDIIRAINHHSKTPDQSQILVLTSPKNNKLVYYSGFAWSKSGQVKSIKDWDAILERQSMIIKNPLIIK